ncbi:MAG: hypothetical protein WCK98_07610 [bacterium]
MSQNIPQQPESVFNTQSLLLAAAVAIPSIMLANVSEIKAANRSLETNEQSVNQVTDSSILPEDKTLKIAQLVLPLDNKINSGEAGNLSNSPTGRKINWSVKSTDGEVTTSVLGAQKFEVGKDLNLSLAGGLIRKPSGENISVLQSNLTYKLGDNVNGIVYGQVATGEQAIVGTGVAARFGSVKLDALYERKGATTFIQTNFSVDF